MIHIQSVYVFLPLSEFKTYVTSQYQNVYNHNKLNMSFVLNFKRLYDSPVIVLNIHEIFATVC